MILPRACIYSVLALLALSGIGQATKTKPSSVAEADTSDSTPIDFLNDGVLLISGKQTSCEIAFISKQHGLLAANCLFNDANQPLYTDDLKVATHGSGESEVIAVEGLVIHPDYDSQSLANNVAVVVFTTDSDKIASPKAPLNTTKWDDRALFRRVLADTDGPVWNDPLLGRVTDEGQDLCSVASPIYAANDNDFICDQGSIAPGDPISSCKLPFGMSYGAVLNQGTAPMAIYSHTVVFGDGLCSSSKKVHYYTILRNYLAWGLDAASGLGKSLDADQAMKANNIGSKSYKMNPPENPLPVVQLYGGNLYAHLPVSIIMSSSTTISPSANITDPTEPATDNSNGEPTEPATNNSDGEPTETATDNGGSDSDSDGESGLDTAETPLPTSDNSLSEQESVQPSGIIPSVPDYSTTTVEITSYVTITTYSNQPASSAPTSFTNGGDETGLDTSCTDETVVDTSEYPCTETVEPTDTGDYDCTETVYVDGDCSDGSETASDGSNEGSISSGTTGAGTDSGSDMTDTTGVTDMSDMSDMSDTSADSTAGNTDDTDDDVVNNIGTLIPFNPDDDTANSDNASSGGDTAGSDIASSDASSDADNSSDIASDVETLAPLDPSDSASSGGDESGTGAAGSDNSELGTDDGGIDSASDDSSNDESQTDDDSSVSGADSSPNNDNQESGGISRTTAILVGILVPLAIIIIIVCLYFYFKKK
ncbi:hypothetical protein IW148_005205 [Coemansia sp. RSA 1199]|nr:hypothetical protein IW148_005205 [Coemansia sp. RSA 1199]